MANLAKDSVPRIEPKAWIDYRTALENRLWAPCAIKTDPKLRFRGHSYFPAGHAAGLPVKNDELQPSLLNMDTCIGVLQNANASLWKDASHVSACIQQLGVDYH